jgi:hypothetical protein
MRELTVLETCLQRGVLIYFVEQGLARLEELVSPGQPRPSWLEETGLAQTNRQ